MKLTRLRRPSACDEDLPVIPPRVAEFVVDEPRLTLFDGDGRRIDRAAGFTRRYLVRDPVPQVKRPTP